MTPPLRLLVVRPERTAEHGGDEVVYRRALGALEARGQVDVLELASVGRIAKLANVARGNPPELARYVSRGNVARVARAVAATRYDAVFFFNEVTFPARPGAGAVPAVLCAHNVHSVVARTEPSALGRAFLAHARAFERRWYADPAATLVCISQTDVAGLRAVGIDRDPVFVVPPGPPPPSPLRDDATVLAEAAVTGSYGWWRKRRDLAWFAGDGDIGVPIWAPDPAGAALLRDAGRALLAAEPDWSAGVRFGLVTDRFLGGFKLKSLEYVARNCVVIGLCDMAPEFEGLPHADEFVRHARDAGEVRAIVAGMLADDPAATVARFRTFRAACLGRYDWARCLSPLGDALDAATAR